MTKNEHSLGESGDFKVLFVCTANICRSPMAEAIFDDLARERGLNASAESAGVRAERGSDMSSNAREVLSEMGITAGEHSSRRVSEGVVSGVNLILTMEHSHTGFLEDSFDLAGKVFTLPQFTLSRGESEVSDPYGLTKFAYRASAKQIYLYTKDALDIIEQDLQAQ